MRKESEEAGETMLTAVLKWWGSSTIESRFRFKGPEDERRSVLFRCDFKARPLSRLVSSQPFFLFAKIILTVWGTGQAAG